MVELLIHYKFNRKCENENKFFIFKKFIQHDSPHQQPNITKYIYININIKIFLIELKN